MKTEPNDTYEAEPIETAATPEPQPAAEQVKVADLVNEAAPPAESEDNSQAAQQPLPGDLLGEAPPKQASQGRPGKSNRRIEHYAALDWSKSNSQLARETGVSRQRITQIRHELEDRRKAGRPVIPETPSESEVASFADITGEPETPLQPEAAPAMASVNTNYQLLAETTFDMSAGLAVMMIGPEWQPRMIQHEGQTIDERANTCSALAKYFESIQAKDLPPGVILAFTIVSYAAPRFAVDNTRNKFQLGYSWVKVKLGGFLSKLRSKRNNTVKQLKAE